VVTQIIAELKIRARCHGRENLDTRGRFGGGRQRSEQTNKWELMSCGKPRQNRNDGQHNTKKQYCVTKEFVTFARRIPPPPPPPRSTDTQVDLAGKCWVANRPFLKSHYQPITNTVSSKQNMLPPPSYCNYHSKVLISPSKILARFQGITVVWLKIQACRDV